MEWGSAFGGGYQLVDPFDEIEGVRYARRGVQPGWVSSTMFGVQVR